MKTQIFLLSMVFVSVFFQTCSLSYVELDKDIRFHGRPPDIYSQVIPQANAIYVEGTIINHHDTTYALSYGIVWGTSPDPTLENSESKELGNLPRSSCCPSEIEFEYTIPDLLYGRTYYVRAYARLNGVKTQAFYGSEHEVEMGFGIIFSSGQDIFQGVTIAFSTNLENTFNYNFLWSFSDGSSYDNPSPVHAFNSTGPVEVQVRATSRSNSDLFEARTAFNIENNPFEGYWKQVDGGSFNMGCDGNDCGDTEKPAHNVSIRPFEIGVTEVTHKQWEAVMGNFYNSTYDYCDECPVEGVSWDDIAYSFIPVLHSKTGWAVRLPTEAEWEYAARGGNQSLGYRYSGGNILDEVGWHYQNSGGYPRPVGTKKPNELGLYDMSGNVEEWVKDCGHSNYFGAPADGSAWLEEGGGLCDLRVLRGGSCYDEPGACRSEYRSGDYRYERKSGYGFRLARD